MSVVREALRITLLTRAAVFLVGFLAIGTFGHAPPFGVDKHQELGTLPDRWDASWYLGVASGGYRWNTDETNPRVAFFPGFPLAVRAAAGILRLPDDKVSWLWTGVGLSIVFFFLALIWLQRLAIDYGATATEAANACWLIACYPFSLFYGQFYSESLFLLCAVLACYFARRRAWYTSAMAGVMVGLVRPTGGLVSLMVAWTAVEHVREGQARQAGAWMPPTIAVLAPWIGIAAYSAYMYRVTGDALVWMHAHGLWGRTPASPWLPVGKLLDAIRANGFAAAVLSSPYDFLNGAAALSALAAVIPVGRRFGWGAAGFVLASVMIPLTAGGLLSMGRLTSVLFPVFLWLALRRHPSPALLATFATVQGLLAALFFTDRGIF